MRYLFPLLVAVLVLAGAACAPAQPAPAPTKAAPAPTTAAAAPTTAAAPAKPAAEPTKAPAAAPTAVPAKKVEFPEKGRAIAINCPWPAGGNNDILSRLLAVGLEKELGVPVRVENKAGAASQVGLAEFVQAKPDGYTLAMTSLPSTQLVYLDLDRKPTFSFKDFVPVSMVIVDPLAVSVKNSGPFKTIKDVFDAAKANPDKVRVGDSGLGSAVHMASMLISKSAGVKWSYVHFDGDPPGMAALVGEHIEVFIGAPGTAMSLLKGGEIRMLAHTDSQETLEMVPGTKSLKSMGYDVVYSLARGYAVPAGTPKEIVGVLEAAIKKVAESDDFSKKIKDSGLTIRYLNSADYTKLWSDMEKQLLPLIAEAKKQ